MLHDSTSLREALHSNIAIWTHYIQLHSEREALHSRRCQNEAKSLDILRLKSQIVHFSYGVAVSQ